MGSRDDYCPVAKAVQILGDRWCLLLVREMLRGVQNFNEFERSVPGISRSVLAQRLRRLERADILERRVEEGSRSVDYLLTDAGWELANVVGALNDWGESWLIPDARPSEIDPDGLMLWIRRHIVLYRLPSHRVVVAFELRARGKRRYWLVLQPGEASLCPDNPGFEEDLYVTATTTTIYHLFLGRLALGAAVEDGLIHIDGPPSLIRAFPSWFRLRE